MLTLSALAQERLPSVPLLKDANLEQIKKWKTAHVLYTNGFERADSVPLMEAVCRVLGYVDVRCVDSKGAAYDGIVHITMEGTPLSASYISPGLSSGPFAALAAKTLYTGARVRGQISFMRDGHTMISLPFDAQTNPKERGSDSQTNSVAEDFGCA